MRWITSQITVVNGKAKLEPKLSASNPTLSPLEPVCVEPCNSICYDPKEILLQNRYLSQEPSLTAYSSNTIWPSIPPVIHTYICIYIYTYTSTQKRLVGKGNRSLRGLNVWRNCWQRFRNRMYFLKLLARRALGSSCSWDPLFSVLCLPAEPWPPSHPWLGRPPSPGRGTQILPTMLCVTQNAESGFRQQRQGANFHNATQVPCPPTSAHIKEKVNKTTKTTKASAFSLTGGTLKYPQRCTPQLFLLPHKYMLQNHSFTTYKVKATKWLEKPGGRVFPSVPLDLSARLP